ncbi:DUF1810 family protein [Limnohabitans sp.]|uniref:DUF1810 domain-containing protein n=1 Tax=Limnohabitans sp. TaxID=1907725 RepID=UPI0025BAF176|nr:DUF1810 family protein [Limnohabitans sp.]
MHTQTLHDIRKEAAISQRLWVNVLGMLQQNWCVLEQSTGGSVDLVFFEDHGHVFDWMTFASFDAAEAALRANGFVWMWESSSFYSTAGVPVLPGPDDRKRSRSVYSNGKYWEATSDRVVPVKSHDRPTDNPRDSLDRFVNAQDLHWYTVVEELAAGRKQTHWMWFFFPQLRVIGSSKLAVYFGLSDPREAANYWDNDVLGSRLRSCAAMLLDLPAATQAEMVFGKVDAMKLRSCMTLFENVSYADELVVQILDRYFYGARCPLTLEIIRNSRSARQMFISR